MTDKIEQTIKLLTDEGRRKGFLTYSEMSKLMDDHEQVSEHETGQRKQPDHQGTGSPYPKRSFSLLLQPYGGRLSGDQRRKRSR